MDIKTKYNIGDKVFYVDQNAIKRGVILLMGSTQKLKSQ